MQAITRDDLKIMNETGHEDFVLVNVLPQDAFNEAYIRTSINIRFDEDDFETIAARVVGDKQRKVVVYCAHFDCDASPKAAHKLENAGFTNVFDYEAGTRDWFEQKAAA